MGGGEWSSQLDCTRSCRLYGAHAGSGWALQEVTGSNELNELARAAPIADSPPPSASARPRSQTSSSLSLSPPRVPGQGWMGLHHLLGSPWRLRASPCAPETRCRVAIHRARLQFLARSLAQVPCNITCNSPPTGSRCVLFSCSEHMHLHVFGRSGIAPPPERCYSVRRSWPACLPMPPPHAVLSLAYRMCRGGTLHLESGNAACRRLDSSREAGWDNILHSGPA